MEKKTDHQKVLLIEGFWSQSLRVYSLRLPSLHVTSQSSFYTICMRFTLTSVCSFFARSPVCIVYRKETLPRPQSLAITGVPQSPLSLGKACGGGRRKPISVVVYLPNRSRDLVFSTDPVAPAPRTPAPYYPLNQIRMRCVVSALRRLLKKSQLPRKY